MSEYQYYEFRAIDRSLTEEEQATVGKLSSRVNMSPTHAIFVYNYSDFPARAEEILAKYFDAMLYMTHYSRRTLVVADVAYFSEEAFIIQRVSPRTTAAKNWSTGAYWSVSITTLPSVKKVLSSVSLNKCCERRG